MQESNEQSAGAESVAANSNLRRRSTRSSAIVDPANEKVDEQLMEEMKKQLMEELTLVEHHNILNKDPTANPTQVCYKLIFDKIFFIIIFILFLHLCSLN